jgi:hypothetical protein
LGKRYFIGIDNGVTGGVCVLDEKEQIILTSPVPVFKTKNFQKKEKNVTRVSIADYETLLKSIGEGEKEALIERPLINPSRFEATLSAIRCLEATLICLESHGISYSFIDSKQWQKRFLGDKAKAERLKTDSINYAKRKWKDYFKDKKVKDGVSDACLIALFLAKQKNQYVIRT